MSKQLELFGGYSKSGDADWTGQPAYREGDEGAQTPESPTANIGHDPRSRQDRHHNPSVGRGPVQTTGLAQALGNARSPYDFSEPDPRAEPRPEWIPPEWLRLPGVDDPA